MSDKTTRRVPLATTVKAWLLVAITTTFTYSQAFSVFPRTNQRTQSHSASNNGSRGSSILFPPSLASSLLPIPPSPPDDSGAEMMQIDNPLLAVTIQTALSKMQNVMTMDFFDSSSGSVKQLHKKCVKAVKVAPSSIRGAGLGVFAQMNIKKGTIVSFFPAHGIGVDYGESSICIGSQIGNDQEFFQSQDDTRPNYLHYLIGSRPLLGNADRDFPLFIDVNPNRQSVPGWMSHYINDGAIVYNNSERGVLDYYESSSLAKNCVNVPFGPSPIMVTVVTRKVKKGEELFTSYGCSYWLEALLTSSGEADSTDITEPIQVQVKNTAKDLFVAMKGVQETYEKEAGYLQSAFDSL